MYLEISLTKVFREIFKWSLIDVKEITIKKILYESKSLLNLIFLAYTLRSFRARLFPSINSKYIYFHFIMQKVRRRAAKADRFRSRQFSVDKIQLCRDARKCARRQVI